MSDICFFCGDFFIEPMKLKFHELGCSRRSFSEKQCELTSASQRIAALEALVMKMGKLLLNHQIAITGAQDAEAYDATDKFLSRPEVKALLSPPREPHQPEKEKE